MLGIFLDTETNGLSLLKHKVIEIAFEIVDMMTGEVLATFQSIVSTTQEEWKKSDKESLRINGFTWEQVALGISPQAVGASIEKLFIENKIKRGQAVFICQNPSFDRAFFSQLVDPEKQEALLWPYHWLDLASMYWVKALEKANLNQGPFPWENGLSKDKIAASYKLNSEQNPHRAINGVNHLILCYESVVGFPKKPKVSK